MFRGSVTFGWRTRVFSGRPAGAGKDPVESPGAGRKFLNPSRGTFPSGRVAPSRHERRFAGRDRRAAAGAPSGETGRRRLCPLRSCALQACVVPSWSGSDGSRRGGHTIRIRKTPEPSSGGAPARAGQGSALRALQKGGGTEEKGQRRKTKSIAISQSWLFFAHVFILPPLTFRTNFHKIVPYQQKTRPSAVEKNMEERICPNSSPRMAEKVSSALF